VSNALTTCSAFDRDTHVDAIAKHQFAADITDRWNGLHGRPLGGYVLAVCLKALRETIAFPDLLVVSAFFLRPVSPGQVEVHTDISRIGRRVATGEARLTQDGTEALTVVATFTDFTKLDGPTSMFETPPELPSPDDAIDIRRGSSLPAVSLLDRVEYRVAKTPGWRRGQPSGQPRSELWMRLTDDNDGDTLTLPFLADAAAPAVMEIGAIGSTTLELTVHVRAKPSPGWFACRANTRYVIDGYHDEDFEIWGEDGNLVAQSRQLAILQTPNHPDSSTATDRSAPARTVWTREGRRPGP
jgi:acyl-CoA thioesterase